MAAVNRWYYSENGDEEYLTKVFEQKGENVLCGRYIFDGAGIEYWTGTLKESELGKEVSNGEGKEIMERWESESPPILEEGEISPDIGERRYTDYIFKEE